jgi:hypothetical protein
MKLENFIKIWNKNYYYIIEPINDNISRIVCDSANINQDFLNEDLVSLLNDLPNLIKAEQDYCLKQDSIVRFRISWVEKLKLMKNVQKSWHKNMSSYIKSRIMDFKN